VFEKRRMSEKGQQLYSLRNVGYGWRMNYKDGGDVVCPSHSNTNFVRTKTTRSGRQKGETYGSLSPCNSNNDLIQSSLSNLSY
jgi:hypothetical protein